MYWMDDRLVVQQGALSKSNKKEPDHVKEESNLLLDKMCQETTNFCHRRTFEENVTINFTYSLFW